MQLSDFDYNLPPELIAQSPCATREGSRLMELSRKDGQIYHHSSFTEILNIIQPGDVLVLNNTKVVPARIFGQKPTGGKVEMLVTSYQGKEAQALIKTKKRPVIGDVYDFSGLKITVVAPVENQWRLEFSDDVEEFLESKGVPPLPPYIKRKEIIPEQLRQDQDRYQTVYAEKKGAIAAPTAGLHFTEDILARLKGMGVEILYVTLHVGMATFIPIKAENVVDHQMGEEEYEITPEVARKINSARNENRRIIAVGSTSCRTLESAFDGKKVCSGSGVSRLFIYPGKEFHVVSGMITNFHLPKSTLMLLVSAFASRDLIMSAYEQAVVEDYRFFSYGDAMVIL